MNKPLIAVILGGFSAERPVSIKTGKAVFEAINKNRYDVIFLDGSTLDQIDQLPEPHEYQSFEKYLNNQNNRRPDLMFLALHGTFGEDGGIQNYLDKLNIKYTSSGAKSSANAMDKVISKQIFRDTHLPIAPDTIVDTNEKIYLDRVAEQIGYPLVVKPVSQGSSVGISMVKKSQELPSAIKLALKFDDRVMIEKHITGSELTIAVVGNDEPIAWPVIEIIPRKSDFFDYEEKYSESGAREVCPADISDSISSKAKKLAIQAHLALKCRGISRTDMILEKGSNKLFILETNTIPGMTPASLLPKAAKAAGIDFEGLVQKIIDLAMEE